MCSVAYALSKTIEFTVTFSLNGFYSQKYRMCMKKLDFVNDTLEELGISKDYDRTRKSVKYSIISWCLIFCLTLDLLHYIQAYGIENFLSLFILLIEDSILYINILLDLEIVFIFKLVYSIYIIVT